MRRLQQIEEAQAKTSFFCGLASPNDRFEDVSIKAIVVAELKRRDVQRHVFGIHLVEGADPAFEDRPKTLNRVGVDCTDYILAAVAIDRAVRIFFAQFRIAFQASVASTLTLLETTSRTKLVAMTLTPQSRR
ncbi:MAG: hypothetical protein ABSC37_04490 [Xanthobacteraceae bacterium]